MLRSVRLFGDSFLRSKGGIYSDLESELNHGWSMFGLLCMQAYWYSVYGNCDVCCFACYGELVIELGK
jgi:hypothetical protein